MNEEIDYNYSESRNFQQYLASDNVRRNCIKLRHHKIISNSVSKFIIFRGFQTFVQCAGHFID